MQADFQRWRPTGAHLPDRHAHIAWCDASNLTGLIEERGPDLWVHGHVYRHADYRVEQSRVVCNARGHVEERTDFVPGLVVDVA